MHWGLTLERAGADGPASIATDGGRILAASPGRLASRGGCELVAEGFVARCAIGRGKATIIADADFLNVEGEDALDGDTAQSRPAGGANWRGSKLAKAARVTWPITLHILIHRL